MLISKLTCWVGFHDWLCLTRWLSLDENQNPRFEFTGWTCSRCGKTRQEQWDY